MEDFKTMDLDKDHAVSYVELKNWVDAKAKMDPNWKIFTADGVPVLKIAHKIASSKLDKSSTVHASKVVEIAEFRTLLIQMFVFVVLWSHFEIANKWEEEADDVGTHHKLDFTQFRLAVKTLNSAHSKQELSDEQLSADFEMLTKGNKDTVGFIEVLK